MQCFYPIQAQIKLPVSVGKLQPFTHMQGYNKSIPYHMIQTQTITIQDSPIPQLNFPSQQELTLSPTLSARSEKDHSVTETHCSQSTSTNIATDSEEDEEQEPEEYCENFHSEGCCMRGANCSVKHSPVGLSGRRGLISALAMNFPQLLVVCRRRSQSFLE